jgi:hypothetical protein
VTYRAELSERVLEQLGDFPAKAFDALIAAMAKVVEYPDDPMETFPTSDPYVRRADFGARHAPSDRTLCDADHDANAASALPALAPVLHRALTCT